MSLRCRGHAALPGPCLWVSGRHVCCSCRLLLLTLGLLSKNLDAYGCILCRGSCLCRIAVCTGRISRWRLRCYGISRHVGVFCEQQSGNVTTPRLETLTLPDTVSVTLVQPRKREVRWTNLGYRKGLVRIAIRKLDLQGLDPSGAHSRMQSQCCRTPHLGFVA